MEHEPDHDSWLRGQMLIATPAIGDPRFERSVIFLCSHSAEAAMGIVVNKPHDGLLVSDLLNQLELSEHHTAHDQAVLMGGPVDGDRGFVLHSADYNAGDATMAVSGDVALTATKEALAAMTTSGPPERAILALGYAGWGPGQLEHEVQRNAWLTCDAADDLIFGVDHANKWAAALESIGVSPSKLSLFTGEA